MSEADGLGARARPVVHVHVCEAAAAARSMTSPLLAAVEATNPIPMQTETPTQPIVQQEAVPEPQIPTPAACDKASATTLTYTGVVVKESVPPKRCMSMHANSLTDPDTDPDDDHSEHSSDDSSDSDSNSSSSSDSGDDLTAAERHECFACSRVFSSNFRLNQHEHSNSCIPKLTSHSVELEAIRAVHTLVQSHEVEVFTKTEDNINDILPPAGEGEPTDAQLLPMYYTHGWAKTPAHRKGKVRTTQIYLHFARLKCALTLH